MRQYHELLRLVLESGYHKSDRTGTGTLSVFGAQTRFNLSQGFPLLTTKKLHLKSIIHELLWFLRGDTNVRSLQEVGVTIWNEWADADGNLGRVYGAQWTDWRTPDGRSINQIHDAIARIRRDPDSRRHLVCAWNPGEIDSMALPPCHKTYQFHVADNVLSCILFQRSCDLGLGFAFNAFSAALLTRMLAAVCGYKAGELIWQGGDVHLYLNHASLVEEQLSRTPAGSPKLKLLRTPNSIFDFTIEDFEVPNYQPQSHISAPVAV
jgi:thymidylate synthase